MSRDDRKLLREGGRRAFEAGLPRNTAVQQGLENPTHWLAGYDEAAAERRRAEARQRVYEEAREWGEMTIEQRFDYLFDTISDLKARVAALEE
jgi:hypothetical protein